MFHVESVLRGLWKTAREAR